MLRFKTLPNQDKGYILVVVVFMMLAMAVMAAGMNRRAGLQAKMAVNQTRSTQINLGQVAALEEAAWRLSQSPTWRTTTSGATYVFDGISYNRKVLASSITGYGDVVTVTVAAPGGFKKLSSGFRIIPQTVIYYLIADTDNHAIRRVDSSTGVITSIAGTGSSGYSGDGGKAIQAKLNKPRGVAADALGNIYISDSDNHVIREINTLGDIDTIAGNGSAGYSGDNGPANLAQLNKPRGVFVHASGKIYIADTENHVIRMVYDDAGTRKITTVAGNGSAGYSGDNGPANLAQLDKPNGVFVDVSDNIYIADTENHVIRMVYDDAGTMKITTVAGDGSGGYLGDDMPATSSRLNKPRGVWLDESGNILIADADNNRARLVYDDGGTMMITTVAGDGSAAYSGDNGPATSASLKKPHAVCVYEAQAPSYLHIADADNDRVRMVDSSIRIITTVAGTWWAGYNGDGFPAKWARLYYPRGVHVDGSRNVYIADTYNHRIRKVDGDTGIITTVAGNGSKGFSGDGGPATNAKLRYPYNVFVDTAGNIFIVDTMNYRIRKVDAGTGIITTVAGDGNAGNRGDGGPATAASIRKSFDAAVDGEGNLYIADTHNHIIRKVDATTGIITTVVGNSNAGYSGDGGLATDAELNKPYSVFVDPFGNIYLADTKNDVIRMVDGTTNIITTVAGNGTSGDSGDGGPATQAQLDEPKGVWVDSSDNIFIADTYNDRIKRVDATTNVITTVAGTGSYGYNGDNILATDAALFTPTDICVHEPSSLEKLSVVYGQ
jgi:hypothetical protein